MFAISGCKSCIARLNISFGTHSEFDESEPNSS